MVDFAIAGSALLISLISLSVAIHHGRVQEKLVAANSWPFLTWSVSNITSADSQYLQLKIANSGVGPAVLKSLVVRYDGKPVRGWVELLQECCGVARNLSVPELLPLGVKAENRPVGIIRAHEDVVLLLLQRMPEHSQVWDKLSDARLKLTFDACYCSIIGECWRSDLRSLDPPRTEACKAGPDDYVELGAGFDEMPTLPARPPQ